MELLCREVFGESGIEGVIMAIEYVRKNKIPFLGLCYGMQLAVVEYSRNALGWKDANTAEINSKSSHVVIDICRNKRKIWRTEIMVLPCDSGPIRRFCDTAVPLGCLRQVGDFGKTPSPIRS